jgi:spermidine synthase
MTTRASYLYLLSFLEGGAVMACELIGAKMLAPFFGTSLYVWAAALGLTLGGLMSGYFLGGILSQRSGKNANLLYIILLLAGLFLFLMPFNSPWIMRATLQMSVQWGAVLSLLVFMFPPLVFMGMVSPVIINLLTMDAAAAGNRAGNVYAISTLGGILITFLFGFYVIPEFGISRPAMVAGITLAALPAVSLLRRRKYSGAILLLALLTLMIMRTPGSRGEAQVLYHSEGVLGQVKVIEMPLPVYGGERPFRVLVVNNTMQTILDKDDPHYDFWPYTGYIPRLAAELAPGRKAFLLGMGGGTLVNRLAERGFVVEAVEIDARIGAVAARFFDLDPGQTVRIDDARRFLKTTRERYDLAVYDLLRGESAPEHLFTRQAFEETAALLAQDGVLLINFYGYVDGELGRLARSVLKTLQAAGFDIDLYATPGEPDARNLIVAATPGSATRQAYSFTPLELPALDDALVLSDEQPRLALFAGAAMQWRELYNRYLTRQLSTTPFQ